MATTNRTEDQVIWRWEVSLARWDEEDDLLQWGALDDDTLLMTEGNPTDWDKTTPTTPTTWTKI